MVGSGANSADDFVGLGCGKNELHVLWRLFHDLQQGVKALLSDHMGLIEDEDLETVPGRSENGSFSEVSGVINTVVAGGIYFNHIQ